MKRRNLTGLLTLMLLFAIPLSLSAAFSFEPFAETEQGAIAILHHVYQNGESNDEFDYVNQGGQENLYPFQRYAVGATLAHRHRVWFTYQPLTLVTNVQFEEEVKIGTVTFSDTPPWN